MPSATQIRIAAAVCAFCTLLIVGCDRLTSNPCSGLSNGEREPAKEKYLPCAAAMLDRMGQIDAGLVKLSEGDEEGRHEALENMAELQSLIKAAGGLNKLRATWADNDLNQLNYNLVSAYEFYQLETFAQGHPVKRLRGEVSMHNVETARRGADEARSWYRYAKR